MYSSENDVILVVPKFWPLNEVYQKRVMNTPAMKEKVRLQRSLCSMPVSELSLRFLEVGQ